MSEEKKDILSINDILKNASRETESKLSESTPDFSVPVPEQAEAPETVTAEEAKDEESEVISEYSGMKKTDPKMSTRRLRELLEAQIGEDKVLLEYFKGKDVDASRNVKDIRRMIDEKPKGKPKPALHGKGEERFTDEEPEKESFVQEKLFSFGDTMQLDELPLDGGEKASFDDFADLSERIVSGEIPLESEDDDKDQITFGVDEEVAVEEDSADASKKDLKLRMVFDMMNGGELPPKGETPLDGSDMFKKASNSDKVKKKRKKERKKVEEEHGYDYKSPAQRDEVFSMLSRATAIYRLKLIAMAILSFLILYMELADYTSDRAAFLHQGRYGAIYILADLQLLCFGAMLMAEPFLAGLRAMASWRLTADSIMSLSMLCSAVMCTVSLAVDPTALELKLYCLPAILAATANCFVKYLQCSKDKACFKVLASKREKFTAQPLTGVTDESNVFTGSLDGESDLYTARKTAFVDGFLARTNRRPKSEDIFNVLVPVTFVAAIALFMALYVNGTDIYTAFSNSALLFCAATPLTSFFMISLPAIAANLTAKKTSSALIGTAVVEEYADAAVLSFADTEAFLPGKVTVTSIKTYGDMPIDEIITRFAMLFDYIEGPLKPVAANMVDRLPKPESITLIDNDSDGLYIIMDGVDYFLGKRSYMLHNKLAPPVDANDEVYSRNIGSVMYMAINNNVVAKIYVKYGISPGFDGLLESMYNAGVCVGIKTLDPNIDNELLQKSIKYKNCPVAVLKGNNPEEMHGTAERVDSGIVSASSLHNFLKMFILCDKARHATKSNCIINIAAILVTVFAVAFLSLTGDIGGYNSLHVALFQLLWMLPTGLVSFLL